MVQTVSDRRERLEEALDRIEKAFGPGAVMRGGAAPQRVEAVPTGALGLDLALGVGGLPRGRVVEIFGPEGAGKTTLAMSVAAQAQRLGDAVAYIDAEHALDLSWAEAVGVEASELLLAQPDCAETALGILERLVRSGAVGVAVVDSVAALAPRAEIEGEMGDSHVGLQARLMSQAMRKLVAATDQAGTLVVMVNQLRERVGVQWGSPEVTPGGRALKFYASVRLEVRRVELLKAGGEPVGQRVRVKVVKNKCAPPFRQAEIDIRQGLGIDALGAILDAATASGVVRVAGGHWSWEGRSLGRGRQAALEALAEAPGAARALEAEVRRLAGLG